VDGERVAQKDASGFPSEEDILAAVSRRAGTDVTK